MGKCNSLIAGIALAALSAGSALAGAIPYPNSGTPNPVTYTFTAAATGDIIAYFAGKGGASYNEYVGLLVNGVDTGITGLDNQTSSIGDALNFGSVNAGDTLTFYDYVYDIGLTWYTNPALNSDGGNHVYSTAAAAGQAYLGSPAGVYVAFEDLIFPGSDYNYQDDTFVFTNTSVVGTPEASTWVMMLAGFGGLGFAAFRRSRKAMVTLA